MNKHMEDMYALLCLVMDDDSTRETFSVEWAAIQDDHAALIEEGDNG